MIIKVSDYLAIGSTQTRIAVVVFGSYANILFNFDTFLIRSSLRTALATVPRIGGQSNFYLMLNSVKDLLTTSFRGNRDDVRDVVLIFTDGYDGTPNFDLNAAIAVSKEIKALGANINGKC